LQINTESLHFAQGIVQRIGIFLQITTKNYYMALFLLNQ